MLGRQLLFDSVYGKCGAIVQMYDRWARINLTDGEVVLCAYTNLVNLQVSGSGHRA